MSLCERGLSPEQIAIINELVEALSGLRGVAAIALGGSFARGRAQADSDIDLGVFYSESAAFSIDALRERVRGLHDGDEPTVTDFYEWGPWVNGGAWLTIRGQRVDILYRSLEHEDRVIDDAKRGRYESHYEQQPPFGFFGPTYLGELQIAVPLLDPDRQLAARKEHARAYPEALRRAIVRDKLWAVQFGVSAFARKFASRGEVFLTAASLARFVHQLVLALFAINRTHLVNDKTALSEVERFELAPKHFRARAQALLAEVGRDAGALAQSVSALEALWRETAELAGDLYRARPLPPP